MCVREAHFVLVHCAVYNNVGPEGMKHLGKALERNRKFHLCRRQWARVFLATLRCSDLGFGSDAAETDEQFGLHVFFAKSPGLIKWISTICLQFYGIVEAVEL